MKQRGFIAAVLAAVLLTGAAITVMAQPPAGPHGPGASIGRGPGGPGGFGFPGLRQLDLTEAQQEQIKTIHQSHRQESQQIRERMRTAERELNEAAEGPVVDEANIRSKANAVAAAMADGTIHRAKVNAEIFNVLTSEQQEKLKTLRAEAQERMKNRGGQRERRQRGQ
jgi:Spy/CpxP family protein refolding chaperone